MWAIGRFDLGLAPGEFGRMTPRLFSELLGRLREREKDLDLRAGTIAATVANGLYDVSKRPPFTPADFFSRLAKPKPAQTPEQMFAAIQLWDRVLKVKNGANQGTRPVKGKASK